MSEWVQASDGTEARRVPDGIEVRRQGRVDSTVYRVKEANRDWLAKVYPSLFQAEPATAAEIAAAVVVPATPPKKRTSKKK